MLKLICLDQSTVKLQLYLCTNESVFLFNRKLDTQCDGVAMASIVGPLLADVFMSNFGRKMLDECPSDIKTCYI